MKKAIIPAIALLAGINTVSAQAKNEFKYGLSEISVGTFEKVRINAHVQVVLVNNAEMGKVFVEGDQQYLDHVVVAVENGELVIRPGKQFSGKEKLLITIPAGKAKPEAVAGL